MIKKYGEEEGLKKFNNYSNRQRYTNTLEYFIITYDEFEINKEITGYNPDILKIVNYFKDKEAVNPHAVNPEYLKLTEAEESKMS